MAQFVEGSKTLDEGVKALIDGAIADYTRYQSASMAYMAHTVNIAQPLPLTPEQAETRVRWREEYLDESIAEYTNSIRSKKGKKYIKVIQGGSVHCFIVATADDGQFNLGDVLKAESWSRPARNRARGNVFKGFTIEWTGAPYLHTTTGMFFGS